MYAPIFSLLSPWTYGRVALYLLSSLTRPRFHSQISLFHDLVSILGYLCFTYRL
jgi:hypothetical protein